MGIQLLGLNNGGTRRCIDQTQGSFSYPVVLWGIYRGELLLDTTGSAEVGETSFELVSTIRSPLMTAFHQHVQLPHMQHMFAQGVDSCRGYVDLGIAYHIL